MVVLQTSQSTSAQHFEGNTCNVTAAPRRWSGDIPESAVLHGLSTAWMLAAPTCIAFFSGVDLDIACTVVQVHFKRLSSAQVLHLQAEIDRELSLLTLHRLERQQEGASSRASKLHVKRINRGRKAVRSLLLNWVYWYKQDHPGTPAPIVTAEDALRGSLPWHPEEGPAGSHGPTTAEALKLRLHRVTAELERSVEELLFWPGEAANSLNLYRYQITGLTFAIWSHIRDGGELAAGKVFMLRGILGRSLALECGAQAAYAKAGLRFHS